MPNSNGATALINPERGPAPSARKGPAVLLVLVCSWIGLMVFLAPSSRPPVVCERDRAVDADTVVMLSASWCGYCRRARDFLQSANIAHCEYDVETTAEGRRQFSASAVKVVPIIKIRNDTFVGFNRSEIMQSLIAHGLAEFGDYD